MNGIILNEKSKEYLETVFNSYTEKEYTNQVIDNPVIHMYATHDTYNERELFGYADSLFCEVHVYDVKNDYKYTFENKDGISLSHADVYQVRIFKDGSTMIMLNGSHELEVFQALELFKCK